MSTQTTNNSILRLGDLPKNLYGRVTTLPKDVASRGRDVWLAGLGALALAEEEGSNLYQNLVQQGEKLVERGEKMEETGKKRIESVRDDVTTRQRKVTGTVEEQVYEPLLTALKRFGVPTRAEVQELSSSVDALTRRVNTLIEKLGDRAALERTVYAVEAAEEGWEVRRLGQEAPVGKHATKDEALEDARSLANENAPSQLVIYRKDGSVQDTLTYDA